MIKKNTFVFSLIFIFFFSLFVNADENTANTKIKHSALWFSIGAAKDFSFSVGGRGVNWGIEIGGVFDGEYSSDEVLDYPVPHGYYTDLGEHKVGDTYGLDVLYYFFNKNEISIGGGVGMYMTEKAEIAQSNATGWLYKQSSKTQIKPAIMVNFDYFVPNKRLVLGLSLHSLRGIVFRLGIGY